MNEVHEPGRHSPNTTAYRRWRGREWLFCVVLMCIAVANQVAADPIPAWMRAVHMEGNWGGNQQGIKLAGPSPLASASTISASAINAMVSRGSFVDSTGATITNDVAQIRLANVTLGTGTTLATAGFWVVRNVADGSLLIQFRPSLDTSLADVPGFARDLAFPVASDGSSANAADLGSASGYALEFVLAVLAHGADLVRAGGVSVLPPATFDQPAIVQTFVWLDADLSAGLSEYFAFLKAENVEWIGISVALFYGGLDDPTVTVKYRTAGDTSGDIFTFDDQDLINFITNARGQGFKIYLTLAFEPSSIPISLSDPTCHTASIKVNRYMLGNPVYSSTDPSFACVNPGDWWWNPNHPNYAANISTFWNTYTIAAKKYAILAQQTGVELYSLGTETENLFRSRSGTPPYTNNFQSELRNMVAQVRSVYAGAVTYDQHFTALTHPEYYGNASVYLFADLQLDVVGVSAYFPLTSVPPTSVLAVSDLELAWTAIFNDYLVPLQAANPSKPIVFTEFGATDSVGAPFLASSEELAAEPPRDPTGATDGMRQQQNLFQAFFNVDERYGNVIRGAFVWGNQIFLNQPWLCNEIYFNIYCKPSAGTIKDIYARWEAITGAAVDLNQHGLTGSWYEPASSGQGVEVEVYPDLSPGMGSTFVSWFTYDTVSGGADRQRWYTAQGPVVSGQPSASLTIYQNSGGNFNAPPTTTAQAVGTAALSFDSCSSGQLSYTFTDGTGRTGNIPLTRITQNVTCSTTTPYPTNADFALSGNWYEASTSGQGFTVEVNPNSGAFFAAWYTYMPNGTMAGVAGQRWYTAQGPFAPGMRSIPVTIYETTGGMFDQPTPPGQTTVPVGTGTMAFQSCSAATFSYNFSGGTSVGLSGTIPLSRVGPTPPGCTS